MTPESPMERRRHEAKLRRLWASIARLSPDVARHIRERAENMLNTGRQVNSVAAFVCSMHRADAHFGPRDWMTLGPSDLRGFLQAQRASCAQATVKLTSVHFRSQLRWLHNTDLLPAAMERELRVQKPRANFQGTVIKPETLEALLAGLRPTLSRTQPAFQGHIRDRALYRTAVETGHRISEILSLNVGDIDTTGPTIVIRLRPDAKLLKTGARTLHILDAQGDLKAWIASHPARHDPGAPLFPCSYGMPLTRLSADAARRQLYNHQGACPATASLGRRIKPHDFRHTAATTKASLGWNDAQLRQYFGWSGTSPMPAHYVHLNLDAQRERILADAHRTTTPLGTADQAAILAALRDLVRSHA